MVSILACYSILMAAYGFVRIRYVRFIDTRIVEPYFKAGDIERATWWIQFKEQLHTAVFILVLVALGLYIWKVVPRWLHGTRWAMVALAVILVLGLPLLVGTVRGFIGAQDGCLLLPPGPPGTPPPVGCGPPSFFRF